MFILTYLNDCVSCLVSLVVQLLVVSALSWFITKKIKKRLNREVLTSYKRAVLITGCDSGFGNALAFKLNENGYRVYATVLDPQSDGAKKLMIESRFDDKTHVLRMDVTKDEEVMSVYEKVKNDLREKGEELWSVVNNAGLFLYGPFDWGTVDNYKQIFEVNTFGMVRVTRTFLPLLRQSKGRVVNLCSFVGRVTLPDMSIYSMSKHAAVSFSDAVRRELKKYGIRVSTLEPFVYNTKLANNECIDRQIDRLWADTSDEVKQVYGQDYCRQFKDEKEKLISILKPSNNIHQVIDLLLDAVRSGEPEIKYFAIDGNWLTKAIISIAMALPNELIDLVITLRNIFLV